MYLSVDFFGFILVLIFWASWIWIYISFPRFGKVFAIISPNNLYVSLSPHPLSLSLSVSVSLHEFLRLSSLFFIFFFFFNFLFWLNHFKWPVLKFTNSFFFCSSLLLNPSTKIFNSVILFFWSKISVWLFFNIFYFFVSILILLIIFLSWLSTFIMAIL